MNSIVILLLCVALSAASYAPTYYQPGFTRGLVLLMLIISIHCDMLHLDRPHGIAAVYRNDLRQEAVNYRAKAVGASAGTSDYYGVPGAGRYVFDNRYPSYAHQGYGPVHNSYGHH